MTVEVLERVRQVGANKEGAKGSYTVYRIASGPEAYTARQLRISRQHLP